MTFEDVQSALEKGTVIFNAAGGHIPKLAGPCLVGRSAAVCRKAGYPGKLTPAFEY